MDSLTLYVARDGDDGWSGSQAEANAERTDGPFATPGGARDAVRRMRGANTVDGPVTILIREGKYYLDRTLVLGPADSGTRDCPITYKAYPGEKPILSGGRELTQWQEYQGEILQSPLPEAKGGRWKFRQLFLNGRRQIRARYPDFEVADPLHGGWAFMEGPAEEGSQTTFRYKPATFPRRWARPHLGEVNVFPGIGWHNNIVPIEAVDEQRRVMTLARSTRDFNRAPWFTINPFRPGNRFYVANLLEELTRPGEWCLDWEEGVVYFWPPEPIEGAEVVVPALDCLIDLRGASWINIEGLTFTETTDGDNLVRDGAAGAGAMFPVSGWRYCGDAVHVRDTAYCRIERNFFDAVGGNAIYLEWYNLRNTISRNQISGAGANGVVLAGGKRWHPAPAAFVEQGSIALKGFGHLGTEQPHPMFNQIVDNHIHHCGFFNKYSAGVFLGVSDGNVVAHNLIEYLPHHGVNLGNNGFGRNIVEYNRIHHVGLETYDNGGINCWMEDESEPERSGHVIRHNLISDIHGPPVRYYGHEDLLPDISGIYLDNYVSNCFVYGNIIARCEGNGIVVHSGKNNLIENNVVMDAGACQIRYQYYYNPMPGFMTGHRCCRNIFYLTKPGSRLYYLHGCTERTQAECDYNVYFNAAGGGYESVEETKGKPGSWDRQIPFDQWQGMGYDEHSVLADPLFEDVQGDDYRLKADSPAVKLGFVPIDTTRMGIRPER